MATIINYFLESSVIFFVLFLFYHFCFAPYKNFNFNRIFLLFSAVFALIIPLMHFPLFLAGDETVSSQSFRNVIMLPEVIISDTSSKLAHSNAQSWNVGQILAIVYSIGFVSFLIRLLLRLYKVKSFINNNRDKIVDKGFYYLIPTGGKISTCSFFEYLLWDETQELTSHQQQQIIEHEEAHIKNKHSYDVLIIEILCVVFWFNPVIYFYKAALTTLHEYIADHKAAEGTSVNEYIKLLSYQTLHAMKLTLGNNFFQTQIFNRMKMLKNEKRRSWWSRLSLAIPVFALMIYVFACETEQVENADISDLPENVSTISVDQVDDLIANEFKTIKQDYPDEKIALVTLSEKERPDFDSWNVLYMHQIKKDGKIDDSNTGNLNEIKSLQAILIHNQDRNAKEMQEFIHNLRIKYAKPDKNGVYTYIEKQPQPKEGIQKFYEYVMQNLKYPESAKKDGIEGRVFVQFVVNKSGEFEQIEVVRGVKESLDQEAIRVLSNAPKWEPGYHNDKPVKVRMVLPINFKLDSKNQLEDKIGDTNQKKEVKNTGDKVERNSNDNKE